MTQRPWRTVDRGIAVRVRLTPKAGRDRVDGITTLADGSVAIRAAVTAPPADGKANAALLHLLAKTWRLPRSTLEISAGATSRLKTVTLHGDATPLLERLEGWCADTLTPAEKETR